MMTMKDLESKLQKADRKQAKLYLFCNFISLMLITAYSALMLSPTVLNILPEGGDSRKQMVAIYVLTIFGCIIFTIYAASLFFRTKSRQLGTMMALGAPKKVLVPGLMREVLTLSGASSIAGTIAGFPFVVLLWSVFRMIIKSEEMKLSFNFGALWISAIFSLLVIGFACFTAFRYLSRTNIMDVVHEEHKNEPVKELGRWCGPAGIALLLIGAIAGYSAPGIYKRLFSAYPPALLNITYAPVFIGLYMIMLHTVVNGWIASKKNPYKDIITRSMMKFQGKQTVNNLLVSTVLIAGACFAIFYIPMLGAGQVLDTNSREYDYVYNYRADQDVMDKQEVENLAGDYELKLKDRKETEYISLGMDGYEEVEEENRSFHVEHTDLVQEGRFLSASGFNLMTGQNIEVEPGSYYAVSNEEEIGLYYLNNGAGILTDMVTRKELKTEFAGYLHYNLMTDTIGWYVLSDEDYEEISKSLTAEWMGSLVYFNIDGEDSYEFANSFFENFVNCFDKSCETPSYYDRVYKIGINEKGEVYWGDTDSMTKISFDKPNASDFRAYWTYMPKMRIMDQTDFLRSFAVYLMMFLFIAIVCSLAALIIGYTRCQTIVLNNRYVFDDLKRLGASPEFIIKQVKSQASKVFKIPAMVGMTAMFILYTLIMYGNDGRLTSGEISGLMVCFGVTVGFAGVIYVVYKKTISKMKNELGV